MKILILHRKDITNPEVGGGTLYTHRIAKCLVHRGHEVTLICANYPEGRREDNIDGVDVLRLGTKYFTYFFAPIHYFRKFIGKTDVLIDVINGPPWFSPLYSGAPKIAITFQTFKEVFFLELSKPLAFVMYLTEKIFPCIYRNIPVIALSSSVKNELVERNIAKKNIFVISPGIDLEKYKPGKKSDFPLILYVGRLKKYKGIEYLIVSMKEVVKKICDARLIIVGEGSHARELVGLTEKLGLKDIVEFSGYVSEKRKVKLMRKAHVLVIPSIREGWGIPVIEAGACGTPTIGTNTSGLRDTIIDEKTGFLIPYGKPAVIAEKIVKVLKDDRLRDKLSKNAIEWAKKFDWKKSEKKFLNLIDNLLYPSN